MGMYDDSEDNLAGDEEEDSEGWVDAGPLVF